MTHSFYEYLNIPKNASTEEVKKAYRKLAIQHHPDKGGDVEMFKKISNAYEILSSPEKREMYDRLGDEGFNESDTANPHFGFNMFNMFNNIFNSFVVKRKDDAVIQLDITLEECYNGVSKDIKLNLEKRCMKCNTRCVDCKGTGTQEIKLRFGPILQTIYQKCNRCNGEKNVNTASCEQCVNGIIKETINVKIDIPRGVPQNYRIIKEGLGIQADTSDETPGNLIVVINILPHSHLTIRENNLVYNLNISFIESIIGKTIEIPHIASSLEIDLSSYGVLKDGEYVVKGKGMPLLNSQLFGDLVLKVNISYPTKKLNDIEKRILKKCLATIFEL